MDIIRFLKDRHISFWTEGKNVTPGWANITCPLPLCGDTSNHGGFNLTAPKLYYNCWKCGWSPLDKVIAALTGTSRRQAQDLIELYRGRTHLPELEIEQRPLVIPGGPLQQIHKDYLIKRRFNPDYIENKYKIKGTGPLGNFKFRLIIPITYEKLEVSFHSRDVTDRAQLRYKACPKTQELIHHKEIFYGLDYVQGETLVIVEGPLDVWRLGDGAIATFGTMLTKRQIELLVALKPKQVFTLFDSGKLERTQSNKIGRELEPFMKVFRIDLQEGDPCDLTPEKVKKLRREVGL